MYGTLVSSQKDFKLFDVCMADMSSEQNCVLSFLKLQVRSVLSNGVFFDRVTFIQGGAGTGKSFFFEEHVQLCSF